MEAINRTLKQWNNWVHQLTLSSRKHEFHKILCRKVLSLRFRQRAEKNSQKVGNRYRSGGYALTFTEEVKRSLVRKYKCNTREKISKIIWFKLDKNVNTTEILQSYTGYKRIHGKGRCIMYKINGMGKYFELGDICYSVLCPSQHVNIALSCLAWGRNRTLRHGGGFPRMLSHSSPGLCLPCQGWQTLFINLTFHLIIYYHYFLYEYTTATSVQTVSWIFLNPFYL